MSSVHGVTAASEGDGRNLEDRCPWCGQIIPHEKFKKIREGIEAEERKRSAEVEERLKAEVTRERADAESRAQDEMAKIRTEAAAEKEAAIEGTRKATTQAFELKVTEAEKAKAIVEQQLVTLKATEEATNKQRLLEQRRALEKDKMDALHAEQARNFKERQKLEGQLQLLQRQVQNKTANELGEGAEIDLFEALKERFPQDLITRIGKGKEGADILHRVREDGRECGCIVYDSKNRTSWRAVYVSKLRKDQLAAKADHAILVTLAFPAGVQQLCLRGGVIVLNPARTLVVVEMVRKHIAQVHFLRLSNEARAEKTAELYDFIMSERSAQLFAQIETKTDDMLNLDVDEKKAHDAMWKQRGELIRSVQRAEVALSCEIDRIVGGPVVLQVVK